MPYPGAPLSPAGFDMGEITPESLLGPPPADRQAALIAEIKQLASSPNKADRERAEAMVRGMGRNLFMVGLNQATMFPGVRPDARGNPQGLSDRLLTYLGGDRGEYSPEGLAFAGELTKAARPEDYERAEIAGKGANLALKALPPALLLRMLLANPGGTPPSTPGPTPRAPLSPGGLPPPGPDVGPLLPQPGPIPWRLPQGPAGPEPSPPQMPPMPPPSPAAAPAPAPAAPPGPPMLRPARPGAAEDLIEPPPRFLQRPSEPPPIDTPLGPLEGPYNRFLDNPTSGPVPGIRPYPPQILRRIIGPEPGYEGPLPKLKVPPFRGPTGSEGGGAPAAPGAAQARDKKGRFIRSYDD